MSLLRFSRIAKIAVRNSVRFRLQSGLVVFAACLGVAGVLVSTGYADGGRQKILDRFAGLGTDVVTITPQQSRAVGGRARTGAIVETLTSADDKAIKADVDGIAASSAIVTAVFRVRAGDFTKTSSIVGCETDYFHIKHWSTILGAPFDDGDMRRQARVALLGYTTARDLFGANDATGARITINAVPFVVAGVLAERGQGLDAANEDDQIYVPLPVAMHRLMNVDFYGSLMFELRASAGMDAAVESITALLHRRHARFSPTQDDFQVQNQKSLIDAQLAAFSRLSFFIGWIAFSTLAVSAFGIWGVIWMAVRNRSREVGARRAIGATRLDLLQQFLCEAMGGSCLGCAAGVIAAYCAVRRLDAVVGQPFIFGWPAALWTFAASVLLFAIFVAIASGRAAMLDPIAALRAE
jgi:putative ABC transport system permease protein